MNIEVMIDKLQDLKLFGMAEDLGRQMANPTMVELPFEERMQSMIDHECTFRDNRRLRTLLKKAKLPVAASVEDIDYRHARGLDKSVMLTLTKLKWMDLRTNIVLTGPTGTGKSWLSCALGNQACRFGRTTHFIRVPLLLQDMAGARAMGIFRKHLDQLLKFELLILDDWGLEPFVGHASNDILELIEGRSGTRSTIITSQLPMEKWHSAIENKAIADAVMDRLVHSSTHVKLSGESMRSPRKK